MDKGFLMKKLIFACLTAVALVSLSACSTVDENNPAARNISGPQSVLSSPGTTTVTSDRSLPLNRADPP
jgi:outer membrane protein assembly factor BamE (lipoprotein component of BamABCDE complex)